MEVLMTGLSSDLYRRCRSTFMQCSEFDSNAALRAIFVTEELAPFANALPEASNKASRVDATLAYLVEKRLRDGRRRAADLRDCLARPLR